jgi:hypothetical protein
MPSPIFLHQRDQAQPFSTCQSLQTNLESNEAGRQNQCHCTWIIGYPIKMGGIAIKEYAKVTRYESVPGST